MHRFASVMVAALLVTGCSRSRTPASSSSGMTNSAGSPVALAHVVAPPVGDSTNRPRPVLVTAGGAYTNLVYDEAELNDSCDPFMSLDAMEHTVATNTANPDLWYTLGRHYWDGGIDTSNAVACFEKARALAPDALMPRVSLAAAYGAQLRFDDAARELQAALPLVRTEKDYDRWANTVVAAAGGYHSPHSGWALELLQPQAAGHAPVLRCIATFHRYSGNVQGVCDALLAALESTTSTTLRVSLLKEAFQMREDQRAKRFMDRFEAARTRCNLPPFEALMLDIAATKYEQRDARYPELCRRAASMATNLAQRLAALEPLASMYANNSTRAALLREIVAMIIATDTPPPEVTMQMARWFTRSGASNEAVALLNAGLATHSNATAATSLCVALASRAGGLDEAALVSLTNRFPHDAIVFFKIAAFLDGKNWDAAAAEYRAIGVKLCTAPDVQARQAALLAAYYAKKGDTAAAKALLDECGAALGSRAEGAATSAKVLLASGDTNAAFAALLAACTNALNEAGKELVCMPLLNTRWPSTDMRQKAVDAAWRVADALPVNTSDNRRQRFFDALARECLLLNRPDDALRACGNVLATGCDAEQFGPVCRAVNNPDRIESFVRDIIRAAGTQAFMYAVLANSCQQADLPRLALELRAQSWNQTQQPWQRMSQLCETIQLSHELKDTGTRASLLDALEAEVAKNGGYSLYYAQRTLERMGMGERYGKMLLAALDAAKDSADDDLLWSAGRWYLDRGDTNAIRALIAKRFDPEKASLNELMQCAEAYRAIGDRAKAGQLVDQIAACITNAGAVSAHGSSLFWMLRQSGDTARAKRLMHEWIAMPDLDPSEKSQLAEYLSYVGDARGARAIMETALASVPPGNQRTYLMQNMLHMCQRSRDYDGMKRYAQEIANTPDAESWTVQNAANACFHAGMRQEAILMLEQVLDRANNNQYLPRYLRQTLAQYYLAVGDPTSAREHAQAIVDASPLDPDAHASLARILLTASDPRAALDQYRQAFRLAPGEQGSQYIDAIANLVHEHQIEFNAAQFAAELLQEGRTKDRLRAAATILAAGKDMMRAQQLMTDAATQAQTDSQRAEILGQWASMTRTYGTEDQQMKAWRACADASQEPWQRWGAVGQLSRLLSDAGLFDQVVAENEKLIDAMAGSSDRHRYVGELHATVAQASLELGNLDAAWTHIQKMPDKDRGNWNEYLDLATRAGHQADAVTTVEKAYEDCDPQQRLYLAQLLVGSYDKEADADKIAALMAEAEKRAADADDDEARQILELYKSAGQPEKAISFLQSIAGTKDGWERDRALGQLVEMHKDAGSLDKALEWVDAQKPSSDILAMKASVLSAQDKFADALDVYKKALAMVPKESYERGEMVNKAVAAAAKAHDDTLIDQCLRDIRDRRDSTETDRTLQEAALLRTAERYTAAADCYAKVVKATRDERTARSYRENQAECLSEAGKHDDAATIYKDILDDDTLKWEQQVQVREHLVETYQKAGLANKVTDAREEIASTCEKFIKDNPTGSRAMDARFTLARVYKTINEKDEARKLLEGIVRDYRNTSYARRATDQLKELDKKK